MRRTSSTIAGLLASILVGVGLGTPSGCLLCRESDTGDGPLEILATDTEADLLAIERFYDEVWGHRSYEYLAAGTDGTIVVVGREDSGEAWETFVEVFEVGDVSLRAVFVGTSAQLTSNWWAIGDAGLLAISNDQGRSWITMTLAAADLHAIAEVDQRPLIVGDEIVLVRQLDGSWAEPPAPAGGWGSLRGVAWDGARTYAVGLGGVVWSTNDPLGAWTAENTEVDVDLFDVGVEPERIIVVGAEGTVLIQDPDGWRQIDTQVDVDLIDYTDRHALGLDGSVYLVDGAGPLTREDTFAGALALMRSAGRTIVVGEQGLATLPPANECL